MQNFSLSPHAFPSGVFKLETDGPLPLIQPFSEVTQPSTPVCNPALLAAFRDQYSVKPAADVSAGIVFNLERANKVVTESGVSDYSRVLTQLAIELQLATRHCYLAPLRGARFPALFTEVMANNARIQFEPFDYKEGHTRVKAGDRGLRNAVKAILDKQNNGEPRFGIVVIDVVKGGFGIPALVDLIENREHRDTWPRLADRTAPVAQHRPYLATA